MKDVFVGSLIAIIIYLVYMILKVDDIKPVVSYTDSYTFMDIRENGDVIKVLKTHYFNTMSDKEKVPIISRYYDGSPICDYEWVLRFSLDSTTYDTSCYKPIQCSE